MVQVVIVIQEYKDSTVLSLAASPPESIVVVM
jgi:hypothetical protein